MNPRGYEQIVRLGSFCHGDFDLFNSWEAFIGAPDSATLAS